MSLRSGHKEQWLKICETRPEIFTEPPRSSDVGPLSALIDELEFNKVVAGETSAPTKVGCLFKEEQFLRATAAGSISILQDALKQKILVAYRMMGKANQAIQSATVLPNTPAFDRLSAAMMHVRETEPFIEAASRALLEFLRSDD